MRRLPDAAGTIVPVGLGLGGSIATWPTGVFVAGLLLTVALVARRVCGAILLGVLATAVLAIGVEAVAGVGPSGGTNPRGWSLGYPAVPDQVFAVPDLSLLGAVSFDSIGTVTGLSKEAGFLRPDGTLPGVGKVLAVDALGAVVGGVASSSSNTVYLESAAGIADGARTGLATVVTGLLFLAAMFCTPLYTVIPIASPYGRGLVRQTRGTGRVPRRASRRRRYSSSSISPRANRSPSTCSGVRTGGISASLDGRLR